MNRLFVVHKPIFRSSNGYMGAIKRKYHTKKVGFSGTLDPFATGTLIVATGQYTKLFQYLKKTPKSYRATLWLGANSQSLDIENIDRVTLTPPLPLEKITKALESLKGELTYYPPKFSAKKIGGQRAYALARSNQEVKLKQITSTIHDITLLHYTHPFIHFEATVSEGTYIRSLGAMLSDQLGADATLSSLHRLHEGAFYYDNERALNPFEYLDIPNNRYLGSHEDLQLGKKLYKEDFEKQKEGIYLVETRDYFAIIEILPDEVSYRLNRLEKFNQSSL
jgi:tRNA pseudouridine55 synthase